MTLDQSTDIIREALTLMLLVSGPILLAGLIIGLVVSLMQAVTQIQEQTLSFVPKIIGMAVAAIALMPWVTVQIMEFARRMFSGEG